ncbi:tRNA 2-thiouridine(34) synthase MnmA [Candidatus Kaiserbacteria bacterium]|nr:tRNA 2-thiouridine(34) synthase MnmA [Candidatus Kaiserbacteria bacterium]
MAKVFVGLSGGVDSAVAAALLKEQGHDVTGVFIKIWQPEFIECTWREDRLDAMRVAAALGIPFREVDLSEQYKKEVVDTMLADYARGITPNPDVACNRVIKFGHFAKWAHENGADYIATGHYARIAISEDSNYRHLLRGADMNKDQSYFLYRLTQDDLMHTVFPIGDLTKQDVRALAKKFGLPNAEKPDSQGICFLGDVSMEEFLGRFILLEPGKVLDTTAKEIGKHQGAVLYTIGQRHGFSVRSLSRGEREHYVVAIDTRANTITVSPNRFDAAHKEVMLREMNWINPVELPLTAEAQVRYREAPAPVTIGKKGDDVVVTFDSPHIAARGQSLVLYLPAQAGDGERCLGGGIIC